MIFVNIKQFEKQYKRGITGAKMRFNTPSGGMLVYVKFGKKTVGFGERYFFICPDALITV